MAEKRRRKSSPTKLNVESRRIIRNIFYFFKQEYRFMRDHNDAHCDLTPLKNVHNRTCEATGTSRKTLQHILRSEKEVSSPIGSITGQSWCKKSRSQTIEINCQTGHAIRSTMHNIIQEIIRKDNKKAPTWKSFVKNFKDTIGYKGTVTLLKRKLCSMGYNIQGNCDAISVVEKHDIRMRRYRYLTDVNKFREKNMKIVYTGASLIYREKKSGLSYTLLGAGTQDGFLPKTFIIHRSPALYDNKFNINYDKYRKWLEGNLLPNLPKNSVVVVDDVDYNKKQCVIPNEKEKLKDWLRMHNIPFEDDLHKIELLDIVMKNKDKFIAYESDELISQQGLIVLRLPPIHPELNAIEGVFEKVKTSINQLSEENISSYSSHMAMVTSMIDKIKSAPEIWNESCETVKMIEMEYLGYYGSHIKMNIHIHDDDDYDDEQEQELFDSDSLDSDSYDSSVSDE